MTLMIPDGKFTFARTGRGFSQCSYKGSLGVARFSTDPVGIGSLSLTGLPTGTDIVILSAGTDQILAQEDSWPASSYTWIFDVYAGETFVDIGFIKPGYVPFYIRSFKLPRDSASLPIALPIDRNFS